MQFHIPHRTVISLSCIFVLVTQGSSGNLATNKTVYLDPDPSNTHASYTVDGISDTGGVVKYWLVVDLGRNYMVEEVVIDYLSWGGHGFVEVQVFASSPILFPSPYQEGKSCLSQVCYAGSERRTRTFTCSQPLLGRFVKLRRYSFDHPYFRLHETTITGSVAEPCSSRTLQVLPDSIVMTSSSSFTATNSPSFLHCVTTCSTVPGCEAVNFNHVTGQCQSIITTGNDTINRDIEWKVAYYV